MESVECVEECSGDCHRAGAEEGAPRCGGCGEAPKRGGVWPTRNFYGLLASGDVKWRVGPPVRSFGGEWFPGNWLDTGDGEAASQQGATA